MSFFGLGKKPNPPPAGNRNNLSTAQIKLSKALNNIAYHHITKYANAIRANAKAQANAATAVAAATTKPSPENLVKAETARAEAAKAEATQKEAEMAASAAAAGAPEGGAATGAAANAALGAEGAAVNAVASLLARVTAGDFNVKNNSGEVTRFNNTRYNILYGKLPKNANKKNLNLAVAAKKAALVPPSS